MISVKLGQQVITPRGFVGKVIHPYTSELGVREAYVKLELNGNRVRYAVADLRPLVSAMLADGHSPSCGASCMPGSEDYVAACGCECHIPACDECGHGKGDAHTHLWAPANNEAAAQFIYANATCWSEHICSACSPTLYAQALELATGATAS